MEKEMDRAPKMYTRPMVVSQQPIRFETTQSCNRGPSNFNYQGTGNGSGPQNGNGGNNGRGN